MKVINEYKNIALSDTDLLKLVNYKANIVLYENLIYCQNIDQILGE